MTNYRIDYDEDVWVPVPEGDDADWPATLVAHVERRTGTLSPERAADVIAFAEACRAARTEQTGTLLAFCPLAMLPVTGLLAVRVEEVEQPLDLTIAAVDDDAAMLTPALEEVDGGWWGSGRRAAVIVASTEPGIVAGRFNYAFQRDGVALLATAVADSVPFATAMLPYADRLVSHVVLEDS
ncbi:hypothetical protein JNB62_12085 [Microbacterium jejuense]|uniref:Uncharacterized protein n=1 Tax=Microbacterium jejuense TaxID=1263637 RepID=A0ABS7HPQ6_9MICO|nr:hypothetical protein [Microbacterium jejuense]MBW9094424.1 hypothetical protein [Microbacterium jejuense]